MITVSEQQEDKSKKRGVRREMKTEQSHVKETKKIKLILAREKEIYLSSATNLSLICVFIYCIYV